MKGQQLKGKWRDKKHRLSSWGKLEGSAESKAQSVSHCMYHTIYMYGNVYKIRRLFHSKSIHTASYS